VAPRQLAPPTNSSLANLLITLPQAAMQEILLAGYSLTGSEKKCSCSCLNGRLDVQYTLLCSYLEYLSESTFCALEHCSEAIIKALLTKQMF